MAALCEGAGANYDAASSVVRSDEHGMYAAALVAQLDALDFSLVWSETPSSIAVISALDGSVSREAPVERAASSAAAVSATAVLRTAARPKKRKKKRAAAVIQSAPERAEETVQTVEETTPEASETSSVGAEDVLDAVAETGRGAAWLKNRKRAPRLAAMRKYVPYPT